MSRKIIAICGKSASGKSTLISEIEKLAPHITQVVKSHTTRAVRDEFDKTTHDFVTDEYYLKNKHKAISTYNAPEGYVNWTDDDCFSENHINLYAIDSIALNNEFYQVCKERGWDLEVIYVTVPNSVRRRRILCRDKTLENFSNEKHLNKEHLTNFKDIKIVDTREGIDFVIDDIMEFVEDLWER